MTELILKQIRQILIMGASGICVGLVMNVFSLFISRFLPRAKDCEKCGRNRCETKNNGEYTIKIIEKSAQIIIRITECMVIAYLIGEFVFYGQNGKLTFTAIVSFFAGLLLWSKYFCGTITLGENNEQKR